MASAGTITGISNTTTATQSVCPKGWALPTDTQTNSIASDVGGTSYISKFLPVLGGHYTAGSLYNVTVYGFWWASTVYDSAIRHRLGYNGSSLYTDSGGRYTGYYIRCVSSS